MKNLQDLKQILTKTLTTQKYSWRDEALCSDLDPNLFFPKFTGGDSIPNYIAKNLPCARCTVKEECINFADESGEEWGVWGGIYRSPRLKING